MQLNFTQSSSGGGDQPTTARTTAAAMDDVRLHATTTATTVASGAAGSPRPPHPHARLTSLLSTLNVSDELLQLENAVKIHDVSSFDRVWNQRMRLFAAARGGGAGGSHLQDGLLASLRRWLTPVRFADAATEELYQRWETASSTAVRKGCHLYLGFILLVLWVSQPASGFPMQASLWASLAAMLLLWCVAAFHLWWRTTKSITLGLVAVCDTGIGFLIYATSMACQPWCQSAMCGLLPNGLFNGTHHMTSFLFMMLLGPGLRLQVPTLLAHMGLLFLTWFGLFVPRYPVTPASAVGVIIGHVVLCCIVASQVYHRHVSSRIQFHLVIGLSQQVQLNRQAMVELADAHEARVAERVKRERAVLLRDINESIMGYVCHQIRNPLHALRGAVSQLKSALFEGSLVTSVEAENVVFVDEAALQLEKVTDDVLDFQRLQSGSMRQQLASVSVQSIFDAALQPAMSRCHLDCHISSDVPACVTTDGPKISQMLRIGLDNAVKHHRAGTSIKLSCHLTHDAPKSLRFEVWNEGEGLGTMNVEQAFQPYAQLPTSHAGPGGSTSAVGLGLPISRYEYILCTASQSYMCNSMLAELLGGTIGLEDRNRFTVFWLTVPVVAGSAASDLTEEAPVPGAVIVPINHTLPADKPWLYWGQHTQPMSTDSTPLFLVVDDLRTNRRLLVAMLRTFGFRAEELEDGDEIVNWIQEHARTPTACMLDVHMVRTDGRDVTRTLRSLGYGFPIVAVTGNVSQADIRSYESAGFDGVLGKPFTHEHVSQLLGQITTTGAARLEQA